MKRILSIILFLPLLQQKEELKTKGVYYFKPLSDLWHYKYVDPLVATYYVSPSGSDSNPGTIGSPFLTLEKLNSIGLTGGDIVYVRGGTHRSAKAASTGDRINLSNIDGSAGNLISIFAYPGESPVFNFDDVAVTAGGVTGLAIGGCSYLHIKGLRFTGLSQCPTCNGGSGNSVWVFILSGSPNCIIENVEVDNSGMYGFTNGNGCDNNLFLNCDAHHLQDQYTGAPNGPYGGANGFNTGQNGNTSTNVTLRGCRAWWCSDDGFDSYRGTGTDGAEFFENCWSFWNGYIPGTFSTGGDGSGFKLGVTVSNQPTVTLRTLTNCLAFENRNAGFDQNPAYCKIILYNNTSFNNVVSGFKFGYFSGTRPAHVFTNNISWSNQFDYISGDAVAWVETTNSWNGGVTVSDADFVSVSSTGMDGARQSDGSLPVLTFLHLASGSDLIDAGTNVSLPFNNAAPDMGAFETGGSTPPVLNTIKVVRRPKRIE